MSLYILVQKFYKHCICSGVFGLLGGCNVGRCSCFDGAGGKALNVIQIVSYE